MKELSLYMDQLPARKHAEGSPRHWRHVGWESQAVHLLAVIVKVNSFDFGLEELAAVLQVPLQ